MTNIANSKYQPAPQQAATGICHLESRVFAGSSAVLWLQATTLAWMLIECGGSLYAAHRAHSPALLAFGSDSLVELLSATVVALQFLPRFPLSKERASQAAAFLLLALGALVALTTLAAFVFHIRPQPSPLGIALTVAALAIMPVLAGLKRHEAHRINNYALAADAAQSATCAYLALITLVGLALNATLGIAWFDSLAGLAAIPLLLKEGRDAWRGDGCNCH